MAAPEVPKAVLNFAAAASVPKEEVPLRLVQVDGQVVLRIVKHCREASCLFFRNSFASLFQRYLVLLLDLGPNTFPTETAVTVPPLRNRRSRTSSRDSCSD